MDALQLVERAEAGKRAARREACGHREVDLVARARDGIAATRRRDDRGGITIGDDVTDLGGGQMPVDRRHVPAGLMRGEERFDHGRAVVEHGGDAVARREAERAQTVHQAIGAGEERTGGDLGTVGLDHRDPVWARRRDLPESHLGGAHAGDPTPVASELKHVLVCP
jgi:hypothetical protein